MSTGTDESEGLTRPVVRGGRWLFLSQTAVKVMLVVRTLVLIGLLTKEDWGLWAAIYTTLHLLRNLTDASLHMVVIQRPDGDSPDVLITTWWMNVLRGVVLAVLLQTLAPVIARLFPGSGADLTHLLRLVSLIFLMEGFVSIGTVTAERHLAFGRLVLVQEGSALVGIVSGVVLGVILRSVLALLFAEMLRATLLLVLSYVVLPRKPSLAASLEKARGLWHSGWHLYLARLFDFLIVRGPVFLVGPVCGTGQLGLYHLALNFGTVPSDFILTVVNRVTYPAFARMQDDPERLKRALLRVQRFVGVVAAPVCLGIVALAPVVAAFGGREVPFSSHLRFASMVRPMQVFALGVYVTCFSLPNFMVMLGLGRIDVVRRLSSLHLALVVVTVYPLTKGLGITGTAMLVFLGVPIWFVAARAVGRYIDCGPRRQLLNQLFVVGPAAAMGLTAGLLWLLLGTTIVRYTAAVALLCPAAYLGTLWLTARTSLGELVGLLGQALGWPGAGQPGGPEPVEGRLDVRGPEEP